MTCVFHRREKGHENELSHLAAFNLWAAFSFITFLTVFPPVSDKQLFLYYVHQNLSLLPLTMYSVIYPFSVLGHVSLNNDFFFLACEYAMFKFLSLGDPGSKEC